MRLRQHLVDTFAYIAPSRALEQLSADDATRRVAGVPHTIAEIVGHLDFWQGWFLRRVKGVAEPMASTAAAGWPRVTASRWEEVRSSFLDGLEAAAALADDPQRLSARVDPPIEFPALADFTIRDVLEHVATHNAHHLGQVITLRQILGAWPPPSGSWTW